MPAFRAQARGIWKTGLHQQVWLEPQRVTIPFELGITALLTRVETCNEIVDWRGAPLERDTGLNDDNADWNCIQARLPIIHWGLVPIN
jgi:hypothetical protein